MGLISKLDLESAAFLFHMIPRDLEIIRSLRAACSEPVQRFLACPIQLTNRRLKHAGVSRHPRALLAETAGRLLSYGKNPSFDLLSGFRPRRSHLACTQGRKLPHAHARSRLRPFRSRSPDVTSSASPRPAPARPRPSRCRSCTAFSKTASGRSPRPAACWCSRRPANCRARSSTASTPMAATSASPRRWRSAACRWAARSARSCRASKSWSRPPAACSTSCRATG